MIIAVTSKLMALQMWGLCSQLGFGPGENSPSAKGLITVLCSEKETFVCFTRAQGVMTRSSLLCPIALGSLGM